MEFFFGKEVGSPVNQAGQRAIRNGWLASHLHIILVFAWGGFYEPRWIDGSMVTGAIFAGLALMVPVTMFITAIVSYKRHLRFLLAQEHEVSEEIVEPMLRRPYAGEFQIAV